MVQMAMGNEQMYWLQFVLLDIVSDGVALFWIERTAVDDDAFLGLIAYNIAVFLLHVDLESFNM